MKFAAILLLSLLPGCATRNYVDQQVLAGCGRAMDKAHADHMECVEQIDAIERDIKRCVIAGPNLRAALQSRADMQDELMAARERLDSIKRQLDSIDE